MQISSKIFLLLFLTTCALVAQDQIAVDKIIGPTTGRVQIETHIEMPNNSIIFGTDSAGDERRLLYWDNSNDLYVGPEVGIGALATGGDVIIRGVAATNTVVGIEFDAKGASANSAVFAPLSGDSVELGSPTNPFSFTYVQDVLQLLDDGVSGGLVPTFTLEADTSAGGATKLRSSATSSFFLYLPASLPASTECLEVTSGGQIQASGAGCSGSGSASSGTNSEIQLTDNAGGFTTVTNFRYDSGNVALNLPLHIRPHTDSGFDIGAWNLRHDEIYADNVLTDELFIQQEASASHSFLFDLNGTNVLRIRNSGGTVLQQFDEASGTPNVYFNRLVYGLDIFPVATLTYDLGGTSNVWDQLFVDNVDVYTDLMPDSNGGAVIGGSSLRFSTVYSQAFNADGSGQLGDAVSDAWTIFIGSSGNFYIRDTGGASTSISCSGVSDGWMAVTNDNYIVWCDGATRYRVAGASF